MLLTPTEQLQLTEMARLLDEALFHCLKFDGHCKSCEGHISVDFNHSFQRRDGDGTLRVTGVSVYSYVLGPSRQHNFPSVGAALKAVRQWHEAAMAYDGGNYDGMGESSADDHADD